MVYLGGRCQNHTDLRVWGENTLQTAWPPKLEEEFLNSLHLPPKSSYHRNASDLQLFGALTLTLGRLPRSSDAGPQEKH